MYEKLKPCTVCGKIPKIKRDYGYESQMLGAWCTIQCKPFLRKSHLEVGAGAASWNNALKKAFELWNNLVDIGDRNES